MQCCGGDTTTLYYLVKTRPAERIVLHAAIRNAKMGKNWEVMTYGINNDKF